MRLMRITLALVLALYGICTATTATRAQEIVSAEEARSIAVDAYVYFYPLVTMDITRKQSTNMPAGKELGKGPMNMFVNIPEYPPGDFKGVVRPNFDTLYSSGWVDLTREPVVISVPNTNGRYYLLPMLDMWSDVFASPGWRTTGTDAQEILLVSRGWRPELRGEKLVAEFKLPSETQVIEAPTPYVWIIGRTKTDGPADYDAVHKIQAGYKIVPLSARGKPYSPPPVKVDPSIDSKTPPKLQADTMSGEAYFAYAAQLLKLHPPHITDEPIIARMKRIGIVPGDDLDIASLDQAVKTAMQSAPQDAQALMKWKLATLARVANYWSMNTDTMGVYGNYYLKRAVVAQVGLGANLPEDAIYPLNLADSAGQPLSGAGNYIIHFDKGATPPANAFWSITLYDPDGFQIPNPQDRFALSSWMPFETNADGSLDLYFQNSSPGKDKESNWLPAPKGPFNLTMRIYAPKSEALTGKWNPPPVVKTAGPTGIEAQ
jgi:hypothetical protein